MSATHNTTTILSRDQIAKLAPSAFAEHPHHSRSERYEFIPTTSVIEKLLRNDYVCVAAGQTKVRRHRADHHEFAKHLLRFQLRKYAEAERVVNGLVPEVVLINSHNGTSAFSIQAGLFRFVCTNGLVIQSADYGAVKIQHSGKVADEVLEASNHIMAEAPKILAVSQHWSAIPVTRRQQLALATRALDARYGENRPPITAVQALEARRNEDEAPNLWNTFNVLQENLHKGGQIGKSASGRKSTSRAIKSVTNSLNFNRRLWEMADAIARRA